MNAVVVQRYHRVKANSKNIEYPVRTIRIPCVADPQWNQESAGGYLDCQFTIPAEYAAKYGVTEYRPHMTQVWLFDGLSPAYYGVIQSVTPSVNGDIAIVCKGHYQTLNDTRMRIVWDDSDLSSWSLARGSSKNGQIVTESDGQLTISFQQGTSVAGGDYIAVDYTLFDEYTGLRDNKKVDGFYVSAILGNYDGNPNLAFRVYGLSPGPTDTSPTQLYGTTLSAPFVHGENATTGAWASSNGYRTIRVGLWATSAVTFSSAERHIRLDVLKVSSRARTMGVQSDSTPHTSALVQDMFADGTNYRDLPALCTEPSDSASATGIMQTGNIPNSGFQTSGMGFTQWTKPSEILDTLAGIDGNICGMWTPPRRIPKGSYDTDASHLTAQYWYWAPPELTYQSWSSADDPDYYAFLAKGAVWEPDQNPDDIVSSEYVNYPNRHGNNVSVFSDASTYDNYLYAQGAHVADDWTINPTTNIETAQSLGDQYVALRNKPTLSGSLWIYADRPGAVELPGGARLLKLSTVRAGTMWRIPDAKAFRFGRATRIEYTSKTKNSPESLKITLNTPAASRLTRRLNNLTRKADRQRLR